MSMMKRLRHGFIILLLLFASASAQTWELFAPATSGLPIDTIRDIRSNIIPGKNPNATPHLIYILHASRISRFNGLWQYFPDTFGANDSPGQNTVLYFDPGRGLWIGRSNGIHFVSAEDLDSSRPRAENWTKRIFPDTLACVRPVVVSAIYRDRFGTLWVGTINCGLVRFTPQFAYRANSFESRRSGAAQAFAEINEVTDIVEDSSSLWIGTFDGVFRINYAGEMMDHYLGVLWVRNLLVDGDKRIWAATEEGLYLAATRTSTQFDLVWTPKSHDDSTQTIFPMTAVVQDFDGAIWAASETQIYRYRKAAYRDPSSFPPEVFSRQNGWPSQVRDLIRLTVDRAGFVWAASDQEGILRYNMIWETIDLVANPEIGLESNVVKALTWNPNDSSLYVGTENGVVKRDQNARWGKILLAGCGRERVAAFFHDSKGFSLISTPECGRSRLTGYDGKDAVRIACVTCPGAPENSYQAFVKLPNDSLWLAGQFHLWSTRIDSIRQTANFTRLTSSLGFSSGRFNCFLRQNFQDTAFIWIGTETQGLARYNTVNRRVDKLPFVGNFAAKKVSAFHLDRANTLWIGTNLGLTRLQSPFDLKSPQWRDFTDEDPNNEAEGQFVFSADNGDIWFDARDGVGRYNPEAGVTYFPRLSGPLVKDVRLGLSVPEEDEKESFWFGTDQGLTVFHGDRIPPVTRITRPALSDKNFTFLAPNLIRLASNTLLVQYEGGDNLTASSRLDFQKAFMKVDDTTKAGREIEWEPPGFTQSREEFLTFPEAGIYHFYVRTRDQSGNLDPVPACLIIIADIDPPSVVITSPASSPGGIPWVRGDLTVRGSVTDTDLEAFTVELVPEEGNVLLIKEKKREGPGRVLREIRDDTLATHEVSAYHEQKLTIVVSAVDTLQHIRRDTVTVRVDAKPPFFQILRIQNFTQLPLAAADTLMAFRFKERHRTLSLSYRELGKPDSTLTQLENVMSDDDTSDETDSLGVANINIASGLGDHTIEFSFRDLAGNFAKDTLTFTRVAEAVGNRSLVHLSQDRLVEVYLPPGRSALTLRLSPLDDEKYFAKAREKMLEPKSRAYLLEPGEAFERRATLSFKIIDTTAAPNALAIFRYDERGALWTRMGGQINAAAEQTWLRTEITSGGVYLMAQSKSETGILAALQPGNVTCLPRMFSPGHGAIAEFTDVVFSLEKPSPVTIHIFNTAGRQIKALVENENMAPGRHAVRWDGRDNDNDRLRSGIYIVVVKSNAFTETKTVVIQN